MTANNNMKEIYNQIVILTQTDNLSWESRKQAQDRNIKEYKTHNRFYKNLKNTVTEF